MKQSRLRLALSLLGLASLTTPCFTNSDWNTAAPYTTGEPLTATAPAEYGVMYGRLIRLQYSGSANGTLIATYEHFPNDFIIYQSNDDGHNWSSIATVVESHLPKPWTFEGEPHLFELPQKVNNLPAGTILLAGSSVMSNPIGGYLEQQLEIYYSLDHGLTWSYRGTADSTDGSHGGIWEPNLQVASNGDLVMYYSDERSSPTYNQFLGERVSTDGGLTWGAEQQVVAVPDGVQRPGMAVTQKLPNGQYVMSYEWVNNTYPNPARIRFSTDGINWGDPTNWGTAVQASNGSFMGSTPYLLWMPYGGPQGTLMVSGRSVGDSPNTDREIFMNFDMGVGPWVARPAPVQWQGAYVPDGEDFEGWSMGMIPTADGTGIIQMASSYAGNDTNAMLIGRGQILSPYLTYAFLNQNSGMALGAPGNSTTHGTYLQQLDPDASPGEGWTLTDLGNEDFLIVSPSSSLAVDDWNWLTAPGSLVDQWDQNGLAVQQWTPQSLGDGTYKWENINAGLVMGVTGASQTAGAGILLWTDNGTSDHNWRLANQAASHLAVLYPNTVIPGTGTLTIKLTGTGFQVGEQALWNGSALPTSLVSSQELLATVPSTLLTGKSVTNTVTLLDPSGARSDGRTLTVENPLPAVTSINPTSLTLNEIDATITVYGSNFVPNSTIKWSGKGLPTTFISSTELTAAVAPTFLTHKGTATITVVNPVPGGGYSNGAPIAIIQ
jgi:hypothetical protein